MVYWTHYSSVTTVVPLLSARHKTAVLHSGVLWVVFILRYICQASKLPITFSEDIATSFPSSWRIRQSWLFASARTWNRESTLGSENTLDAFLFARCQLCTRSRPKYDHTSLCMIRFDRCHSTHMADCRINYSCRDVICCDSVSRWN